MSVVGDSVRALVGVTLLGVTLFEVLVASREELFDKMLPEKVSRGLKMFLEQSSLHLDTVKPNPYSNIGKPKPYLSGNTVPDKPSDGHAAV